MEAKFLHEMSIDAGNPPNVYTVSRLNYDIRTILEENYSSVALEGEISNFKHHSSGHMYLSLKDDKAQISAVFFNGHNARVKFKVKDGLKVIVIGRVSLYEARGQYQFYIEKMEPQGLGSLQLAFAQLKEKLQKEGLFDPANKKEIPSFPKTVGVVTSPTGAAIQDILNVVKRRFKSTSILLSPVRVQGESAALEIVKAIENMNEFGEADVLIVGRGGGSLEDLWPFNEEIVARAIYKSKIPIISAVGHEVDWTIADWVADLRAPTPSAAAELVVQNCEDLEYRVTVIREKIQHLVAVIIARRKMQLESLISSSALKQPQYLVEQYSQRVDELLKQIQIYIKSTFTLKKEQFQSLVGQVAALSPLSILSRGYSLTSTHHGKLLKQSRDVSQGDEIITKLSKGEILSKVVKINS